MPIVKDYTEILSDVKNRTFQPLYLLHGAEPYFTDVLAKAFEEQAIDEGLRSFNQQIFYGRDSEPGQIVDAASRYPMMAPAQLVLVREAQDLPGIEQLVGYAKQPVPTTILVLAYRGKKLDGKTKLYKALAHGGSVLESKPLYANKLPAHIKRELKDRKRQAEPGVVELLAEYLGTDLGVLAGALDKLVINTPGKSPITTADVETHVGISRQFNVFELQDAFGNKDFGKAVKIGFALSQNERDNPIQLLLGSFYSFFSGVFAVQGVLDASEKTQQEATGIYNSFRLGKIRQAARRWSPEQLMLTIEALADYDLKSKGVDYSIAPGTNGQLTLELVQRLVSIAS